MTDKANTVPFVVIEGKKAGSSKPRPIRGRPHLTDPPGLDTMTFPHDSGPPISAIDRLPTDAERAVSFAPEDQAGQVGPSDLLVAAVDDKGHSAVVPAIRVPPIMHYQITRIVQSGKYPWKTTADFVRWALVEGLTKLSHLSADGLLSDANSRMRAMLEVLAAQRVYTDFAEMIKSSQEAVEELARHGYEARAEQVVRSMWGEIASIRDEEWQRDLRKQFKRAFKEWMVKIEGRTQTQTKTVTRNVTKTAPMKKKVRR